MSSPLRLLIVDDQPALRKLMARHFETKGFEVVTSAELAEAAALLELRKFDAVITDLKLTGLHRSEGLDVVSHARYHCPAAKILVLTGAPSQELERACLDQGADLFLPKPQSMATLLTALVGRPEAA